MQVYHVYTHLWCERVNGGQLFNFNIVICQLYHGQGKLHFDDMTSALYLDQNAYYNLLVLAQWHNRARLEMSLNPYTLFWFRTNMSMPFSLNAVCLAGKQPMQISLYKIWPDRGSNPVIYCTRNKHENHYTTDTVLEFWFS